MIRQNLTVRCKYGLHLLIASQIAKITTSSASAVHVRCRGCPQVNACSALRIMLLEATEGTPIEVTVEGSDEATVLKALEHVFEEGGGI